MVRTIASEATFTVTGCTAIVGLSTRVTCLTPRFHVSCWVLWMSLRSQSWGDTWPRYSCHFTLNKLLPTKRTTGSVIFLSTSNLQGPQNCAHKQSGWVDQEYLRLAHQASRSNAQALCDSLIHSQQAKLLNWTETLWSWPATLVH